jgi:hypothetical protein
MQINNKKPCYIELAQAPPVPRDLLMATPLGECTRATLDLSYGAEHYLPDGTRLWPCSYYINTFMSPELIKWVQDNIEHQPELKSLDLKRITLQTQKPLPNLTCSHIVHSDIGQEWCLFYIIRPGGPNCITRWYQEQGQPLLRNKAGPDGQADTGHVDYCNLTLLEQVHFTKERWYILNISMLHDVQGIEAPRQSLRIYCEPQ